MTYPAPRAELTTLPDVAAVVPTAGMLNLASNELPAGPPAAVLRAINQATAEVNRYPQVASADLTKRLAEVHNVNSTQLVIGNGSANVLRQVLDAMCRPADEILFAVPSFEAYPALARLAGAIPRVAQLGNDTQVEALLAAIHRKKTRVVILSNPHNPTGALATAYDIERFLDSVPANVLVVLDEAYYEFATDPERPDGVALAASGTWPNLVTVRTFSKALGLGGARVGYAVARPDVAAAARKCAVPYSVNVFAQAAAVATLDHLDELTPTLDQVRHDRDEIRSKLVGAGIPVTQSHANFLWLPLGVNAAAFYEHCRARKILVRLYPGHGIRVTIGTLEQNQLFLDTAHAFTQASTDPRYTQ